MFLNLPVWARGASFSPKVLHGHLLLHRQARGARLWAKAKDEAHRQGHQGYMGVSTLLYHRLSQQGTFLLSCLWARVLFDSGASHSFIAASVVVELGLEVEALEEPLYVSSPLGIRARIGMICCGCELEISRILLTVDLRVMDMSEFDVILGMDWLTAYRVVIDCERRRVIAYIQEGTCVTF